MTPSEKYKAAVERLDVAKRAWLDGIDRCRAEEKELWEAMAAWDRAVIERDTGVAPDELRTKEN